MKSRLLFFSLFFLIFSSFTSVWNEPVYAAIKMDEKIARSIHSQFQGIRIGDVIKLKHKVLSEKFGSDYFLQWDGGEIPYTSNENDVRSLWIVTESTRGNQSKRGQIIRTIDNIHLGWADLSIIGWEDNKYNKYFFMLSPYNDPSQSIEIRKDKQGYMYEPGKRVIITKSNVDYERLFIVVEVDGKQNQGEKPIYSNDVIKLGTFCWVDNTVKFYRLHSHSHDQELTVDKTNGKEVIGSVDFHDNGWWQIIKATKPEKLVRKEEKIILGNYVKLGRDGKYLQIDIDNENFVYAGSVDNEEDAVWIIEHDSDDTIALKVKSDKHIYFRLKHYNTGKYLQIGDEKNKGPDFRDAFISDQKDVEEQYFYIPKYSTKGHFSNKGSYIGYGNEIKIHGKGENLFHYALSRGERMYSGITSVEFTSVHGNDGWWDINRPSKKFIEENPQPKDKGYGKGPKGSAPSEAQAQLNVLTQDLLNIYNELKTARELGYPVDPERLHHYRNEYKTRIPGDFEEIKSFHKGKIFKNNEYISALYKVKGEFKKIDKNIGAQAAQESVNQQVNVLRNLKQELESIAPTKERFDQIKAERSKVSNIVSGLDQTLFDNAKYLVDLKALDLIIKQKGLDFDTSDEGKIKRIKLELEGYLNIVKTAQTKGELDNVISQIDSTNTIFEQIRKELPPSVMLYPVTGVQSQIKKILEQAKLRVGLETLTTELNEHIVNLGTVETELLFNDLKTKIDDVNKRFTELQPKLKNANIGTTAFLQAQQKATNSFVAAKKRLGIKKYVSVPFGTTGVSAGTGVAETVSYIPSSSQQSFVSDEVTLASASTGQQGFGYGSYGGYGSYDSYDSGGYDSYGAGAGGYDSYGAEAGGYDSYGAGSFAQPPSYQLGGYDQQYGGQAYDQQQQPMQGPQQQFQQQQPMRCLTKSRINFSTIFIFQWSPASR